MSDRDGGYKKWVGILILLTLSLIMAVVVACDLVLVPTPPPPTATVAAPVPTATLVVDTTPTATPEPLHVESQIYNDNVFILPVAEDLLAGPIWPQRESAIRFYEYFEDRFDFLILVGNLDGSAAVGREGFKLTYSALSNDVRGIGQEITSSFQRWGSAGKLQGVVKLNSYENIARPGWLLHELIHRWGNDIIPPYNHWGGLSSANGLLGGFDISDLVDHGGDQATIKWDFWHFSAGILSRKVTCLSHTALLNCTWRVSYHLKMSQTFGWLRTGIGSTQKKAPASGTTMGTLYSLQAKSEHIPSRTS